MGTLGALITKCPDYGGVPFSSVLINRFHCIALYQAYVCAGIIHNDKNQQCASLPLVNVTYIIMSRLDHVSESRGQELQAHTPQ